jgi:glutaredoxin
MEELKKLIESCQVLVISKTKCKYCTIAKRELKPLNLNVTIIDVDLHPNGALLFQAAKELTNQLTVPNIWINKEHIGGSDKLHERIMQDYSKKITDILESSYDF